MAKTSTVNPRGRNGRFKKRGSGGGTRKRARRRNPSSSHRYGSAKRKRRSNPSSSSSPRRRRRNPTVSQAMAPRRTQNPSGYKMFDIDHVMDIMPAATGGIWAVRAGMKLAGPFEQEPTTTASGQTAMVAVPGIKHALAGVIAAQVGSNLVASLLGDESKAHYAEIAGLGFVGDVFLRTRIFADSQFVHDHLMLSGVDDCMIQDGTEYEENLSGLQTSSALNGEYVIGPDGNLWQEGQLGAGELLHGLQTSSALNGVSRRRRNPAASAGRSSFGYSVG